MTWKTRLIILLATAGIIVSSYLYIQSIKVTCTIGGGCETVLSSKYAHLLGISVSLWGVAWYAVLVGIIYFSLHRRHWPMSYLKIWSGVGLLFSLYLLYLEKFVIHHYCTWCLASLGLVSLIFILSFVKDGRNQ